MKKFNQYIAFLAVFALMFTSCSKDDSGIIDSETAKLSFGAIVNDLAATGAASRQAQEDFPICSTDDPSYVRIVLKQGETEVLGTTANPYRVDLAPGEIFTVEDPALELTAGIYVLDYFAVHNAAGNIIWLAPRGGDYASYVDTALPFPIDLRANVKKYVDVDVLCFDNRDANLYGYQFFDIDTNKVVDFCFFANYCDEDGMHYPARYRLDVWLGTNANGTILHSNEINITDVNEDGDFFARALCVPLPVNEGNRNAPYIYYQLTLLDWDANYGEVETDVIANTLSLADIEANFGAEGEVEYEHFRFGCDGDGGNGGVEDSDGDNVPDNIDDCPNQPGPASNNGCPETACDQTDPALDCDDDGTLNRCDEDNPNYNSFDCDADGVLNGADDCDTVAGPASNNGCPETPCDQTDPNADCDGDTILNKCDEDNPNYATFDCDGDTVLNGVDNCVDEAGTVANNGCPEGCVGLPAICDLDLGNDLPADCYVTVLDAADNGGYVKVNNATDIDLMQTIINEAYGTVSASISGNSILISIDGGLPQDRVTAYEVEVRPSEGEGGTMSTTCWESQCASTVPEGSLPDQPAIEITFDDLQYSYPFYVRVNAVICETIVGE